MPKPAPRPQPLYLHVLFAGCAVMVCAAGFMYLAFLDRELYFDEVGLYNPAYMFQHFGRITYPVHGRFDDMVVHPPPHYLIIGMLMRWGLTLTHAAAAEPVFFLLIAAVLLAVSRFSIPAKFGLLFGTFLGAVIWNDILTVRPDLSLTLAWIAGLIALESGRLSDWSPPRLALGSVLLVYSSAVHYPGFLAQTCILVYAAWALFAVPRKRWLATLGALAAGPCLVGIPYLILFAIPFRYEIWHQIRLSQGPGGALEAIRHQFEAYDFWLREWPFQLNFQPLVQYLLFPPWRFHIPLAMLGPALLALFPSCRGLAIAALPQVLFIAFGARHKQIGYTGYFAPETILYLSGVIAVFFTGVFYVASRLTARALRAAVITIPIIALAALALHDQPGIAGKVAFTKDLDDLDVGRAMSRAILGPSAFVGTTGAGVWYTGGAHDYYYMTPLLYAPDLTGFNPREYFSHFDAVVLDADQTWITWNKQRKSLLSFFVGGDLALRGFWFGDRRTNSTSAFTLLILGLDQGSPQGFVTRHGHTDRFTPTPDGDSILYCAVCPASELKSSGQFDFYATFFLPSDSNDDPRSIPDASRQVMRMLLTDRKQFDRDVVPQARDCRVRYQQTGRLSPVNQQDMVSELRRADRPMKFYRSLAAALGTTGRLNTHNTVRIPNAMNIESIQSGRGARLTKTSDGFDIVTPANAGAPGARIPIAPPRGVSSAYVYVRAIERSGLVCVSVRGECTSVPIETAVYWGSHDDVREMFIPIDSFDGVNELLIRNMQIGTSEILIQDVAVVTRL